MRYPIKNFKDAYYPEGSITQYFGENEELYCKAVQLAPDYCLKGHNGIDIVAQYGTAIYPTTKQKVVEVKKDAGGYGKHVRTLGVVDNFEHTYGHLSNITCELGQILEETDQLGNMGNSGFVVSGATPFWSVNPFGGTHLHYGTRLYAPYTGGAGSVWNLQYSSGDKTLILDWKNGKGGAVDPMTLLRKIDPVMEERKQVLQEIVFFGNLFGWNWLWFRKVRHLLSRLVKL